MQTPKVNVQESETNLHDLLDLVRKGTEVVLTDGATPFARLVPIDRVSAKTRKAGLHAGTIWTSEDFDEPLPDTFWAGA
jgi:antitoxin (DNA-binding transcriptional repressor) of toxin-antitoxin stability system